MTELCVILHVANFSLWDEFTEYLRNIPVNYDLFVTIPKINPRDPSVREYVALMRQNQPNFKVESTEDKIQDLVHRIKNFKQDAIVNIVPNRGLDPAGFLQSMDHIKSLTKASGGKAYGGTYKYLIKLHTKSRDVDWRRKLCNAMLGSKDQYERCVKMFNNDPMIGMIGSGEYLCNSIGEVNKNNIDYYRKHWNITTHQVTFFAGTMFMARFQLFYNAFDKVDLPSCVAEMETGYALDGLKAHALERIFSQIVWNQGYIIHAAP